MDNDFDMLYPTPQRVTLYSALRFAQQAAYAISASTGWHEDDPHNVGERVALLHSECSELLEAYRKDPSEPCGKYWFDGTPIGLTKAQEECADILIRLLDFCQEFGIDLSGAALVKMRYNCTRPHRHGGKAF